MADRKKNGIDLKELGAKAMKIGDLNGDGVIDQKDVQIAMSKMGESTSKVVKNAGDSAGKLVSDAKTSVISAVDKNGNGQIDIEDIIIQGLSFPGIKINREEFLRKEFMKNYQQDVIDDAVANNPAHAKIPASDIDKIAEDVIQRERLAVSGISTLLGTPGGIAMVATIPTDIAQYYGYMLRATQELLYLYGFPQIDTEGNGQVLDSGTMNILIICMGVMYGVAGANKALQLVSTALGKGIEKKLLAAALTKGTIYPFVKKVATWFSVSLTKDVFAGFFKKAIPVVGGVIGGAITYASFKPCCERLKDSLKDTLLSNPDGHKNDKDIVIAGE
jgi:hypothetical protein